MGLRVFVLIMQAPIYTTLIAWGVGVLTTFVLLVR